VTVWPKTRANGVIVVSGSTVMIPARRGICRLAVGMAALEHALHAPKLGYHRRAATIRSGLVLVLGARPTIWLHTICLVSRIESAVEMIAATVVIAVNLVLAHSWIYSWRWLRVRYERSLFDGSTAAKE